MRVCMIQIGERRAIRVKEVSAGRMSCVTEEIHHRIFLFFIENEVRGHFN